jgi:hypothetical protein
MVSIGDWALLRDIRVIMPNERTLSEVSKSFALRNVDVLVHAIRPQLQIANSGASMKATINTTGFGSVIGLKFNSSTAGKLRDRLFYLFTQ